MLSSYKENKDEDNLNLDNDSKISYNHLNNENINSKKMRMATF